MVEPGVFAGTEADGGDEGMGVSGLEGESVMVAVQMVAIGVDRVWAGEFDLEPF